MPEKAQDTAQVDLVGRLRKNSPWIVMAVLLHVITIAVLSVVYLKEHFREVESSAPPVEIAQTIKKEEAPAPVVEPPQVVDRKAIPKNEEAEIVPVDEQVFFPTDPVVEDLHEERGDPNALDNLPPGHTGGTPIGVGDAGGHYGTGVPSPFVSRVAGMGGGKGRGGGATQQTEKAVLEGLRWLLRHRNEGGYWSAEDVLSHCTKKPCSEPGILVTNQHGVGLTGLALLCFLGAGFAHDSRQNIVDTALGRRYFLGQVVKEGLLWLIEQQNQDGSFSEGENNEMMYDQALATLAMSEAYGMTHNRAWLESAQAGVDYLVRAQKLNPDGKGFWGWRYQPRSSADVTTGVSLSPTSEVCESDSSVTTWAVMALKSAELSGLEFPHESFEGALAYMKSVAAVDGRAGYLSREGAGLPVSGLRDQYTYHPSTMSALNMCVRTFIEKDIKDPFLEAAAIQIVRDLPTVTDDKLSIDYYYWYYATLALNQFDGPDSPRKSMKYWTPWNDAIVKLVLELQDQTTGPDDCARGGWLVPDRWCYAGGPLYSTALSVLMLEVYYRYGNAFGGARH